MPPRPASLDHMLAFSVGLPDSVGSARRQPTRRLPRSWISASSLPGKILRHRQPSSLASSPHAAAASPVVFPGQLLTAASAPRPDLARRPAAGVLPSHIGRSDLLPHHGISLLCHRIPCCAVGHLPRNRLPLAPAGLLPHRERCLDVVPTRDHSAKVTPQAGGKSIWWVHGAAAVQWENDGMEKKEKMAGVGALHGWALWMTTRAW
ncbi:hypothetical protein ABZP36_031144, partial [Zizania latifolia]